RGGIHRTPHAAAPGSARPFPFGKSGRLVRVARRPRLPSASSEARAVPRISERVEFSRLAGKVRSGALAGAERGRNTGILPVRPAGFQPVSRNLTGQDAR